MFLIFALRDPDDEFRQSGTVLSGQLTVPMCVIWGSKTGWGTVAFQERFFAADEDVQDEGRELIAEHKETVELFRNFIREYNVGGFGLVYR